MRKLNGRKANINSRTSDLRESGWRPTPPPPAILTYNEGMDPGGYLKDLRAWYGYYIGKGRERPGGETMRLTLHTDFSLRVLIQVGLNDGNLTTINDIAQSFGISKAHLMKVVNDLSQKGYLETVRGRNGGIRLMPNRGTSISEKWCATPRISSMSLAALNTKAIARSSAHACSEALYEMQPRHFWRFWMPILWLI